MIFIWLVVLVIVLLFGVVLLFGAPYLPTRRPQAEAALDLLDLKPGQIFYDLGCGDGRLLKAAAKRGLVAVGYELNPLLVIIAKLVTWRQRKLVKLRWGNFWQADLANADGVFVFLLDRYMGKLDRKLINLNRPIKLASYAFKIPGKKPTKKLNGIFLYSYR